MIHCRKCEKRMGPGTVSINVGNGIIRGGVWVCQCGLWEPIEPWQTKHWEKGAIQHQIISEPAGSEPSES